MLASIIRITFTKVDANYCVVSCEFFFGNANIPGKKNFAAKKPGNAYVLLVRINLLLRDLYRKSLFFEYFSICCFNKHVSWCLFSISYFFEEIFFGNP